MELNKCVCACVCCCLLRCESQAQKAQNTASNLRTDKTRVSDSVTRTQCAASHGNTFCCGRIAELARVSRTSLEHLAHYILQPHMGAEPVGCVLVSSEDFTMRSFGTSGPTRARAKLVALDRTRTRGISAVKRERSPTHCVGWLHTMQTA